MRPSPPKLLSMIALSVFAALLGTLLFVPLGAAAASIGPGYQQPGKPLNHLGGYLTNTGRIAYCIDAGLPSAVGRETSDSGIVGSVNGLGATEMLRLNTVLSRYGDTTDPNTAAAVAMVVWSIAGTNGYQAEGGDAHVLVRAPADQRTAIQTLADRIRAEASAIDTAPPTAALSISIDAGDDFSGILSLDASPGVTGTVVLSNAIFAETGVSTQTEVSAGARLVVSAVPPSGSGGYRVSASSSDLAAPVVPVAAVHVFSTSGAQTLVASGGSATPVLAASASDTRDRLLPSLSTEAQASGTVGGTVIDTATLGDVPSSGVQVRWSGYLQHESSSIPECTAATLAFDTARPVTISTDGVFASEPFPVTDRVVGTVFWIATVSRNGVVVAEGACGDSAETTEIAGITAPPAAVHLPVVSG